MGIEGVDGVDHINIWSKAETQLGRDLSNFAKYPINLPEGRYNSIEAYWYALGVQPEYRDRLQHLYGYNAKYEGKKYRKSHPIKQVLGQDVLSVEDFNAKIEWAMKLKLIEYPPLMLAFKKSELPFEHYYVYGDKKVDAGHKWILAVWEKLRKIAKERDL